MKTKEELAEDHWDWIAGLVDSIPGDTLQWGLETIEYLYETAFIHGFKHGQDAKDEVK